MDFEWNEESDTNNSTLTASEKSFEFGDSEEDSASEAFTLELKSSSVNKLNEQKQERIRAFQYSDGEKVLVFQEKSVVDGDIAREPSTSTGYMIVKTPCPSKLVGCAQKRIRAESVEYWSPHKPRKVPLPLLPWANSREVWQIMVNKEEAASKARDWKIFEKPSNLLPFQRALLVDWMMEVCEAYHCRRVTYHLGVDYLDKFFTLNPSVPINRLQLIGITSLFIAAKVEEIYPPRLEEFAEVTDGACSTEDILECEMVLLIALEWDVCPMTPSAWLNLYLQIHFDAEKVRDQKMHVGMNYDFLFPQYSAYQFVKASNLIDLFSLDPTYLLFSYSIIAAAAVYYIYGKTVALHVSGLEWDDLVDCVKSMAVFYEVLSKSNDPLLETVKECKKCSSPESYSYLTANIPNLMTTENHCCQTHVVNLQYFEKATLLRLEAMGFSIHEILLREKHRLSKNGVKELSSETDSTTVQQSSVTENAEYANGTNSCDSTFELNKNYVFGKILEVINKSITKKVSTRRATC